MRSIINRSGAAGLLAAATVLMLGSIALADILSGSSTTNTSSNVTITQLPLSKPSDAVVGDVLLANVSVKGGTSEDITAPTGWNLILRTDKDTNTTIASYWKVVGASEPASYTWSISPSTRAAGGITSYSGVDTSNPIDVYGGASGKGKVATAPSITTTSDGDKVVALFALDTGASINNDFATSTGMTKEYEIKYTTAGPTTMAEGFTQTTLGSTGTASSTFSTGTTQHNWVAQQIGLRKSSTVPPSSAVAYYKFDADNSNDATPNGFDGTDTDISYGSSSGKINDGTSFNGASSEIALPSGVNGLGNGTNSYSFNAWVYETSDSDPQAILDFWDGSSDGTHDSVRLIYEPSNQFDFQRGTGSDDSVLFASTTSSLNTWHMVTITYDGSMKTIYVDGVNEGIQTDTNSAVSASQGFLGTDQHVLHFNGYLDETGFWNRSLSASEVTGLFNGGGGIQYPF